MVQYLFVFKSWIAPTLTPFFVQLASMHEHFHSFMRSVLHIADQQTNGKFCHCLFEPNDIGSSNIIYMISNILNDNYQIFFLLVHFCNYLPSYFICSTYSLDLNSLKIKYNFLLKSNPAHASNQIISTPLKNHNKIKKKNTKQTNN